MSQNRYSKTWLKNYEARTPNYTMRGKLLPQNAPVANLTCLCPDVEDVRPLKVRSNTIINWETGLIQHKNCGKPLLSMVQNCNGCFEDFWGYKRDLYCKECLPICK